MSEWHQGRINCGFRKRCRYSKARLFNGTGDASSVPDKQALVADQPVGRYWLEMFVSVVAAQLFELAAHPAVRAPTREPMRWTLHRCWRTKLSCLSPPKSASVPIQRWKCRHCGFGQGVFDRLRSSRTQTIIISGRHDLLHQRRGDAFGTKHV